MVRAQNRWKALAKKYAAAEDAGASEAALSKLRYMRDRAFISMQAAQAKVAAYNQTQNWNPGIRKGEKIPCKAVKFNPNGSVTLYR
jgi:hypothetical protein